MARLGGNLAGLFTNNPVNAVSATGQPLIGGSQAANLLTRSVGGLLGKDLRTPQEKLQQGLSAIDPNDPQKMAKMYGLLAQFGTPEQRIAATGKMQELAQNQQNLQRVQRYRDSLIANANQAGLGELTPQIVNANETQLKELAKTIGERQVKLASRGDDDLATVRYMQTRGVTKPDLQTQFGEDLADMPSLDEMIKIADAEDQGDIKAFRDAEGNIQTYATLGQKIRVPETQPDGTVEYKYVNATEAGLSPAPNVVQNISDSEALDKKLAEGQATRILEDFDKAKTATETLGLARQALEMLPYVNTGIFAEGITNVQRVAALLGAPDSITGNAAASQAYFSNRGREFAKFVKNFGSGNGITEKDVKIAQQIVAGEIELDERALEQIIRDSITISENLIGRHNSQVDRLVKRGSSVAGDLVLPPVLELGFDPTEFGMATVAEPGQKTTTDYLREAEGL
jgi:flagellar hook assembly protein FlgD